MKDRTSKHPGRVKLDPVAGQTNTYDMTRADEPDDTGTPFNTRTMLQDSTARFLRIPVSNPFVDDALRHMPDRINPIGTIRTSPALSLGDAWLPCDGSQVTFAEYPQLCQILRNTAGGVTWETTQVGVDPNFRGMSKPILFKGKWYLAGTYKENLNTLDANFTINIAVSDNIVGPYTVIHSETIKSMLFTQNVTDSVQMAASEETIAAVWDGSMKGTGTSSIAATFITWSDDGETWSTRTVRYDPKSTANDLSVSTLRDFQTDGTYWAIADDTGSNIRSVYYIADIKNATHWTLKTGVISYPYQKYGRLSYTNGTWFIPIEKSGKIAIMATKNLAGDWTKYDIGEINGARAVSQIAFYNEKYWAFIAAATGDGGPYIAFSTNLSEWILSTADDLPGESSDWKARSPELIANKRQMIFSMPQGIYTTSDPDVGWDQVTLPAGAPTANLSSYDDILVSTGADTLAHHDYATETRLLPTISISNDTTTFIKAKNELDVFEAQQSGG